MVRLLLEDVTLLKQNEITMHIRFKGGATRTITLPVPPPAWEIRRTDSLVVQEIDRLLDHHTDREIAAILNERGLRSGEGKAFHWRMVARLRHEYGLIDRFTRLRSAGMLTMEEMARRLDVTTTTIKVWRRGLLRAHAYSDRGDYLYEPPDGNLPKKFAHKKPRIPNVACCAAQTGGSAV